MNKEQIDAVLSEYLNQDVTLQYVDNQEVVVTFRGILIDEHGTLCAVIVYDDVTTIHCDLVHYSRIKEFWDLYEDIARIYNS